MATYEQWLYELAAYGLSALGRAIEENQLLKYIPGVKYYAVIAGGVPWEPIHGQEAPTDAFTNNVVLGSRRYPEDTPESDFDELVRAATNGAFATHVTGLDSATFQQPYSRWLWRPTWGEMLSTTVQIRPRGSKIALVMSVATGRADQCRVASQEMLRAMEAELDRRGFNKHSVSSSP